MLPYRRKRIGGVVFRPRPLPLSLTYQSVVGDTANDTNYTMASQGFGAKVREGNNRWLLAAIMGVASSTAGDVASCTIGGIPATKLASAGSMGRPIALFGILNNLLTSAVVAPTFEQTQVHAASATFQLINPISPIPTDSRTASASATSVNTTLTVPHGGVGLGLSSPNVLSGALSWSISVGSITEVFDFNVDGGAGTFVGGAITTQIGLSTITVTQVESGNVIQIFVAAWD